MQTCARLWHLKRNLRRNQGATKRRRQKLPIIEMFHSIIDYVCFTAVLPTSVMFGCFWAFTMKEEVRETCQQDDWATYFEKVYLRSYRVGDHTLLGAYWHHAPHPSSDTVTVPASSLWSKAIQT